MGSRKGKSLASWGSSLGCPTHSELLYVNYIKRIINYLKEKWWESQTVYLYELQFKCAHLS
jgi:hypothetical protein